MLGMMAALLATSVFLLLASYTAMPVSTTHAIVGAIVGVTWVGTGSKCRVGAGLPRIALSWVISPLFSGVIGAGMYFVLHRFVIMAAGAWSYAVNHIQPKHQAGSTHPNDCMFVLCKIRASRLPACRVLLWVMSPLFSGFIGAGMCYVLHRFVIMAVGAWPHAVNHI